MLHLTINEKGGETRRESFDQEEVTIGRVQGNDVILPKGNISKRHSRLVFKDSKVIIVDLKSTNGTYVNGKKITAPQVVKSSDKIYIGDFTLQIDTPVESGAPAHREEEIDLFGGDAPDGPSPGPGLLDDDFDQDFGSGFGDGADDGLPELEVGELPEAQLEPPLAAPPPEPDPEPEPMSFEAPEPRALPESALEPASEAEPSLDDDGPDFEPEPHAEAPSGVAPASPRVDPEAESESGIEPEPKPHPTSPPARAVSSSAASSSAASSSAASSSAEGSGPGWPRRPPSVVRPVQRPSIAPAPSTEEAQPPPSAAGPSAVEAMTQRSAQARILHDVVRELGLSGATAAERVERKAEVRQAAERCAAWEAAAGRVPLAHYGALVGQVTRLATDFEPLAAFLDDADCVEIAVGADLEVYADREGRLEKTGVRVPHPGRLDELIRQFAALGGLDEAPEDFLDVRCGDGTRVVAGRPPAAFRGPLLSVRKTQREAFTLAHLESYGNLSSPMRAFLEQLLQARINLLLVSGPGLSPNATLNALAYALPVEDRVGTLEHGIELHLSADRWSVALEPGYYSLYDLGERARSFRCERLIVGDLMADVDEVMDVVRGPLAGSLLAVSAESPSAALERVADASSSSREVIASVCPVLCFERRFADNARRMTEIAAVSTTEDGDFLIEPLFRFLYEGVGADGVTQGRFEVCGHVPQRLADRVEQGDLLLDLSLLRGS